MACFGHLPGELSDAIFDFIIRPSDLKALCLVSKTVSALAFRHLYRAITLAWSGEDRDWTRLDCLSRSRHLSHIQSIDIGEDKCYRNNLPRNNLQPLLQKLPAGALKSFRYGFHGRLRPENMLTLWRQHGRLRNLQLDLLNLDDLSVWDMVREVKLNRSMFKSLKELELELGNDEDAALSLALFDLLPLKKLRSIRLRYSGLENPIERPRSHTISRMGSALSSRLVPATLTSLSLCWVTLPPPTEWKLSEYQALLSIKFYECSDVGPILDSVDKPKLKLLHIERRTRQIDDTMSLSINRFLQRFGSLEALTVDIVLDIGNRQHLVPAIRGHSLHLKSLCVDEHSDEPGPFVLHKDMETYIELKYLALRLRLDVMMVERCKVCSPSPLMTVAPC